ncbi:MAG: energy transducer TonB [Qipengyuania sp.]
MKALREGEQGIVRVRLIVDDAGNVADCKLENATTAEALPAAACRHLNGAKFEPALDDAGNPVRSYYITKIVYRMG